MLFAATGFLAGFLHVLLGPDHLAAVAPYAAEGRSRPWVIGIRWGLGHAGGVAMVGLLALALRGILPLQALSGWSESIVGVVLIAIGIWGLRLAFSGRLHAHEHTHEGDHHVHVHVHGAEEHADPRAHVHVHAAFAVGTLHGLAGSSHLLGVLPALALPSIGASIAYVAGFGAGTVLAMAGFSTLVGLLARRATLRSDHAYRKLLCACSAVAILVGGFWLAPGLHLG